MDLHQGTRKLTKIQLIRDAFSKLPFLKPNLEFSASSCTLLYNIQDTPLYNNLIICNTHLCSIKDVHRIWNSGTNKTKNAKFHPEILSNLFDCANLKHRQNVLRTEICDEIRALVIMTRHRSLLNLGGSQQGF